MGAAVLFCPGSAPLPEKVVSSFLPDAESCSAQGNGWGNEDLGEVAGGRFTHIGLDPRMSRT